MFDDPLGPIEHFSWGEFVIWGEKHSSTATREIGAGKDICIVGEKVTSWKERKGHKLNIDMITGVLNKNVDVLVLGVGVYGALKCKNKVIKEIKKTGILEVYVLKTPDACKKYNELYREGMRVALLAHGTC
ncbi:MAG: hypothetical protein JW908_07420 [Anaerolineales bacterium]|nr:hypothetical protein [Anaerolineales bacterium]